MADLAQPKQQKIGPVWPGSKVFHLGPSKNWGEEILTLRNKTNEII